MRKNLAVCCYGLVHPDFQGKSIGTSLLLTRLALLNPAEQHHHVLIFAIEKSIGYYRRFGFRPFQPWKDAQGQDHPSGHLAFFSRDIRKCRALLSTHNIIFPPGQDQIPLKEFPSPENPNSKP
jgi:N-acetylglutamate synthase-like GNAT family acetyltransferase